MIRRYKVLYDDTAAGTGDWIDLDSRYERDSNRSIQVDMTAGDTITLQGVSRDVKGIDKSFLDTLEDKEITTLKVYTQSENDVLEGPWRYIRAVKAGTNGNGYIAGMV